jgi:hypothetical protein
MAAMAITVRRLLRQTLRQAILNNLPTHHLLVATDYRSVRAIMSGFHHGVKSAHDQVAL